MDRIKGALYGVCVGDAIGAPLEFIKRLPTPYEVTSAMLMKGGGLIRTQPGQVTDDSEMMICLLHSIQKKTNQFEIYQEWLATDPIDRGTTCVHALTGNIPSSDSQSNGSLMRCIPIGAMSHNQNIYTVARRAMDDARLTHSNEIVLHVNGVYAMIVACLVYGLNVHDAMMKAFSWVISKNDTVREWMIEARDINMKCTPMVNIGHVKHGFMMALWHLRFKTPFQKAIQETIKQGGDTDTNAAIVGGLLGARDGLSGIPAYMVQAVLSSKSTRPDWLHPRVIDSLL